MRLSREKRDELMSVIRTVLPTAQWAPSEIASSPVHFQPYCLCDLRKDPATLTVFLQADLLGQPYNITSRVQHAVEKWARESLVVEGCGICQSRLTIDVRLFRLRETVEESPQQEEEEFDLSF